MRASLPRWNMQEKGISYTLIKSNHHAGENLKAEFFTINPFRKLPVLIDSNIKMSSGDPLKLFKSGAIVLRLVSNIVTILKQLRIKLSPASGYNLPIRLYRQLCLSPAIERGNFRVSRKN